MRLTEQQVQTIRELVRDGFGADARIRLFGSRTDEAAMGGGDATLVTAVNQFADVCATRGLIATA